MTYKTCKSLITKERYEYNDMLQKLDVFLLNDRITADEYAELKALMDADQSKTEQ